MGDRDIQNLIVIFETATNFHEIHVPRRGWVLTYQTIESTESASSATVKVEVQETNSSRGYVITEAAALAVLVKCYRPLSKAFDILISTTSDVGPIKSILLPPPTIYTRQILEELLTRDGRSDRMRHALITLDRACRRDEEPRGVSRQILLSLI